mmetsp:Transcript_121473/g.350706  ORF Transcript_121473/g.350706 Transcript_121473/m.350706 type:complete len:265 (+) Transcript_121473:1677-2471(+)
MEIPGVADLQIRIKIAQVTNIQVFKDAERNDLYVTCAFRSKDLQGRTFSRDVKTDVHKYATHTASFNQQYVFPLQGPSTFTYFEFALWDDDFVSSSDIVYMPKEVHLDREMSIAFARATTGDETPVKLYRTVIFDDWPNKHRRPGQCKRCCLRCCPCCTASKSHKDEHHMYAEMKIEVEIVSGTTAKRDPVEEGQYRVPEGRLTPLGVAGQPGRAAGMLIGPSRLKRIKCCCCACGVPLLILGFVMVLAFLLNQMGVIDIMLKG